MRLNLGCGRNPEPGWVNVDVRHAPGVDRLIDLDTIRSLREFPTASVDTVRAMGLLEHLLHWPDLVSEVARVLAPGGTFEIRVPHRMDYVAFHVSHFDKGSLNPYLSDYRRRDDFFIPRVPRFGSLEFSAPYFVLADRWVEHHFPLSWHVSKVLGRDVSRLPLGPRMNLRFTLRRNGTPWAA